MMTLTLTPSPLRSLAHPATEIVAIRDHGPTLWKPAWLACTGDAVLDKQDARKTVSLASTADDPVHTMTTDGLEFCLYAEVRFSNFIGPLAM
jgi:hypothetical protein